MALLRHQGFSKRHKRLQKLVHPRIQAAVWATVWNRWHTAERHQKHAYFLFGCPCGFLEEGSVQFLGAPDSLAHYRLCPTVRKLSKALGLTLTKRSWWLCDPEQQSDVELITIGLIMAERAAGICEQGAL